MNIRLTNRGKYQVVGDDGNLSRAPCFATPEEAEAYNPQAVDALLGRE